MNKSEIKELYGVMFTDFPDTVSGFLYHFPLSFLQLMISSSEWIPSDESTKCSD